MSLQHLFSPLPQRVFPPLILFIICNLFIHSLKLFQACISFAANPFLQPFIRLFSPHPFIPAAFYRHWLFPIACLSVRITWKLIFLVSFALSHYIPPAPSFSFVRSIRFHLSKEVLFSFPLGSIFSIHPATIKNNENSNDCLREADGGNVKPTFQTGLLNCETWHAF